MFGLIPSVPVYFALSFGLQLAPFLLANKRAIRLYLPFDSFFVRQIVFPCDFSALILEFFNLTENTISNAT